MAINDTSPERRNLILMSLAFIVFYAGDGSFNDGIVKFMLINVTFSKPYVLAYFSWLILFWFCLRYWQKSGFKFWQNLTSEITSSKISPSLTAFAKQKAREQLKGSAITDNESNKIEVQGWSFDKFYLIILCNFKTKTNVGVHQEMVTINGLKGVLLTSKKILVHSIKDNAFSEELMPYVLFCLAISAPHWSDIQ